MPPMEISEIGTLEKVPIWLTNHSMGNRRRGPLRSRTVDTLLHILSICYADSSHIIQHPDKGDDHIASVTKENIPFTCTDITPNDSLHQEEINVDKTQMDLSTQKEGLCNTHVEPSEIKDLSSIFDTNPSTLKNVDQEITISVTDMMISSPQLPTEKDVEEGEISGEFMNLMPEDDVEFVEKTPVIENFNKLSPKSIDTVVDVGKDIASVISKTKRNLVDYSELTLHGKSKESANSKSQQIKNQDFVLIKDNGAQNNSKKRKGSCTDENITNKKAKKSVDRSTCSEDVTTIGENREDANKDADNEKKKKRVLTTERKAKKKRKERIKRAEKNRKLGVKRLKIQPIIKEKKITYCRHYMKGRCHEGENCKFSHDTVPLTKSKPCCHFARHSCMKGDDCPFDHQLSKYPCNNHLTKGFCPRGSDCMFSHEVQPSEPSLNTSNDPKPEHKTPPNLSPKIQINKNDSPNLSNQPPKGVNFISPKLSSQPPKGVSFFTQEKLSLSPQLSPKVNSDLGEITKTPPVIPRGINFLSFGKKPGSDLSNGGFSFKIGKSPLGNMEGKMVNLDDGVKSDTQIENNDKQISSRKPMPVLPFLSSTSQRTLQSTLAFASKFDFGVKSKSGV
ncbi:hypothetical protein L2E82_39444 [Cichorium intybus]|uniref:Uncharacterized protein n=1 Tax=Cichorium intybus TaxID=13427 RepID=A0ACB9AIJ9_CICIN|nr:hypothetical protein L2E82_39444 [Cichorium intybus]